MHSFCCSAEVQVVWVSLGAGGGRGKVVEIKMLLSQAVSLQVATLVTLEKVVSSVLVFPSRERC